MLSDLYMGASDMQKDHDGLAKYANLFWPVHYMRIDYHARTNELKDQMKSLLFRGQEGSPFFKEWLNLYKEAAKASDVNEDLKGRMTASCSDSGTPLFFAAIVSLLGSRVVSSDLWNSLRDSAQANTLQVVLTILASSISLRPSRTCKHTHASISSSEMLKVDLLSI